MTGEQKELIEEKFKGVHALIQANFDVISVDLDYIKKAVDKTNGRVTNLEKVQGNCQTSIDIRKRVDVLEKFNWKLVGIYLGASVVMGVIFAVTLKLLV
jgi:hypothetical protein